MDLPNSRESVTLPHSAISGASDSSKRFVWTFDFPDSNVTFRLEQIPPALAVTAGLEYTAWDRCRHRHGCDRD
jgi:hypothetical protein